MRSRHLAACIQGGHAKRGALLGRLNGAGRQGALGGGGGGWQGVGVVRATGGGAGACSGTAEGLRGGVAQGRAAAVAQGFHGRLGQAGADGGGGFQLEGGGAFLGAQDVEHAGGVAGYAHDFPGGFDAVDVDGRQGEQVVAAGAEAGQPVGVCLGHGKLDGRGRGRQR